MGTTRDPWAAPPPFPAFAWSESRARRFRECRRKHYWAVYHQHNGWLPGAPLDRRASWALGKLVAGWPAALGTTVHARSSECVQAIAAGRALPTFSSLRRAAAHDLNAIFVASRDHLADFWRAPSRWSVLASRFYGEPEDPDGLRRTREALDDALDALLSARELWALVRRAGPDGVWLPTGPRAFLTYQLDGHADTGGRPSERDALSAAAPSAGAPDGRPSLVVYATPDAVIRPPGGAPAEIWDFKTGAHDGAVDQLLTYALGVRDVLQVPPAGALVVGGTPLAGARRDEGTPKGPLTLDVTHADALQYVGRVVALGRGTQLRGPAGAPDAAPFGITAADLAAAEARIRESAAAMRRYVADVPHNVPLPLAEFETTASASRCVRCAYRGLCYPDQHPLPFGAATTVDRVALTPAEPRARVPADAEMC